MGTADRSDDTVAAFSSRGPSAIDRQAKPDLVAPGVGIESLGEAGSTLYDTKPLMRLWGTVQTATEPYLSLSGTSMASPVVSGTIALMLQADPALTPNLVKAILEFTAESHDGYDGLTEGAGFLNARGAVELAQKMAAGLSTLDVTMSQDDPTPWSRHVIWGNRLVGGDALAATAWATDVTWGADAVKGTSADGDGTDIVQGAACGGARCASVVWSTICPDNVDCGSAVRGTNVLDASEDVVWNPARRTPQPPTTNSQTENPAVAELGVAELGVGHYQGPERRR
jgi:subtilisin family serine protease